MLFNIILATILVSIVSFIGIVLSGKKIHEKMHYFVVFSASALLSVAFLDLIPEAMEELLEKISVDNIFLFVLFGVVLFFLVEKFIHWHHCTKTSCHKKPQGALILIGDFVHNFLDGIVIAGAFLINIKTGLIITISVILHEIPQEIGDFAILLNAGYKKKKALFLNFISALSSVIGGIVGYFAIKAITDLAPYITLVAAGGFVYIALSEIVPEIHKHKGKFQIKIKEALIFVLTMIFFKFILEVLH